MFKSLLTVSPYKRVKKYNPHHEPAGSSKGGQFAKSPRGTFGQGQLFGSSPNFFDTPSPFTSEDMSLPKKVKQPWNTKEEIKANVDTAQAELESWLNKGTGVAHSVFDATHMKSNPETTPFSQYPEKGAVLFIGPPKTKSSRFDQKIDQEYGGDAGQLLDVVRATLVFDSPEEVYAAVSKLKENGLILAKQPKDRMKKPLPTQYSDILMNFKLPNGMVGELQLNTKKMFYAKNVLGHKDYEVTRTIEGNYTNSDGTLKPKSEWSQQDIRTYRTHYVKQQRLYSSVREETGLPVVPIDITPIVKALSKGDLTKKEEIMVDRMWDSERYYDYDNTTYKAEAGTPPGTTSHVWLPKEKKWVVNQNKEAAMYGDPITKEEAEY